MSILRQKRNPVTLFDCIIWVLMTLILLAILYPILYVISLSFSSVEHIVANEVTFYPKGLNIEAYKMIFSKPKIPRAYWNSILYAGVGTVLSLVFTAITAYPISRKQMPFRKPLLMFFMVTMFFSGGMIPTYLVVQSTGLIDTIWALVIPNLIGTFYLFVMKSFYEGIPEELHEAAVMDGAQEFWILIRVFLPISLPAIASIALFYAMGNWNSYLLPSIYLTSPEKMPLTVILREMLIEEDIANPSSELARYTSMTPESFKNATIVISMLPMMVLYPFLQKYFVKGMTIGAVKG